MAGGNPTPKEDQLEEAVQDKDVIRARGAEITLIDGSKEWIRYGFAELMQLEEEYGSLDGVSKAIEAAFGETFDFTGKALSFIYKLMEVGLARLGWTDEELNDRLDPALFAEYFEAYSQAYRQAVASRSGNETVPKALDKPTRAMRSPGKSSTTPPPLSLAEPMSSSGA
jgi:hypothetical protein